MSDDDHLARFFPPDPTLTAPREPKMRKIKPRPLHWFQWVTYSIVSLFCIFITYVVVTFLMALNNFADQIKPIFDQLGQ
jgi:hypothetical protein